MFVTFAMQTRLSAVSYDTLFNGRHNGTDRTEKVGLEIMRYEPMMHLAVLIQSRRVTDRYTDGNIIISCCVLHGPTLLYYTVRCLCVSW